jgi:glycerophosphoryl diester phosphodiesterase
MAGHEASRLWIAKGCALPERFSAQWVLYNAAMLLNLPRPAVFAHRGASARAPENTMAAFMLAEADGADALELDAKLSADGEVVVFHDANLERTTNGVGSLASRSLRDLRTLDAGGSFSEQFRGEKIPLLEEIFEAFGGRLPINVELRNYSTPFDGLVPKVCQLVKRHALEEHVLFSSMLPGNLGQTRSLLPLVPRALLAAKGWTGAWARSFGFAFGDYAALHPHLANVSAQQVRRVHRLRRRLHVWTVNAVADLRRLAEWDVDGVFTDDPRLALRVMGRRP